jgi:hypothetical protein
MRVSPLNPTSNALPSGTTDRAIIDAIRASGYPLQGVVADKLLKLGFNVAEEWGYVDRDVGENRNIDVFGWYSFAENSVPGLSPDLGLLIECKQSVHPMVFFKRVGLAFAPNFPLVAGCPKVVISSPKAFSQLALSDFLCVGAMTFGREPPLCSAFARAELDGKKVRLSGEEPYRQIVLPLVKALDYVEDICKLVGLPDVLTPRMSPAVCVVRSAMILVETPQQPLDPVLVPWVRVFRQEAKTEEEMRISGSSHDHCAIDFVHVDFFDSFVKDKLLPFASEFFKRAAESLTIIRKGGEVDDARAWKWGNRISPR